MDVQMPEMDGFEATATIRMREQRSSKHTPIVAMTAHAMQGDRERCMEAGMDGYLAKPVHAAALFEAIGHAVGEPQQNMARPRSTKPEPEVCLPDSGRENLSAVFEPEEALKQCLGKKELLRKILVTFLDNLPKLTGAVDEEFAQNDMKGIGRVAHTIKGAAGNIAAHRLFDAAQALEQAAKAGDESESREAAEILEREALLLERTLHSVLESDATVVRSNGVIE
jgi:CheY-like chemotaxis protein